MGGAINGLGQVRRGKARKASQLQALSSVAIPDVSQSAPGE